MQFIPSLSDLTGELNAHALQPERFASFYSKLFSLWQADFLAGRYCSIKLFDDLFNLLCNRKVNAYGFMGQCQLQCVIEADGGIYPCDFYVTDEWRAGSLAENTLSTLRQTKRMQSFLTRPRAHAALCEACPYRNLCGGCVRMRRNIYLNEEGTFCGYRMFLQQNTEYINAVLRYMQRGH